MNNEIVAPVVTVTANSINTITARILATKDTVGKILAMAYIELGGLLTQAKELIPPGEWTSYLANEVEFSHRTANNCMKLYSEYIKNPESQALASMPYTKAIRFLSLPESEREEFLEEHDVENMSTRELDQAIKDRNEARDAQKKAEGMAAELKAVQSAQKEEIAQLTLARDEAVAAAEDARQKLQELKANPEVPKSVIKELSDKAAKVAAETYQKKLDDALAAQRTAEAAAQAAQQKLSAAQNSARASTPEAAAFSVLYPQIENSFNQLTGCYKKVAIADPELGDKMKGLMRQLVERFQKAVQD